MEFSTTYPCFKERKFLLVGPKSTLRNGYGKYTSFHVYAWYSMFFCLTPTPNIYLGHFTQTVCICKIQKSWTKKLGDLKRNECPFSRFKCKRFKFLSERSVIAITVLVVLYTYLLNLSQRKAKVNRMQILYWATYVSRAWKWYPLGTWLTWSHQRKKQIAFGQHCLTKYLNAKWP